MGDRELARARIERGQMTVTLQLYLYNLFEILDLKMTDWNPDDFDLNLTFFRSISSVLILHSEAGAEFS